MYYFVYQDDTFPVMIVGKNNQHFNYLDRWFIKKNDFKVNNKDLCIDLNKFYNSSQFIIVNSFLYRSSFFSSYEDALLVKDFVIKNKHINLELKPDLFKIKKLEEDFVDIFLIEKNSFKIQKITVLKQISLFLKNSYDRNNLLEGNYFNKIYKKEKDAKFDVINKLMTSFLKIDQDSLKLVFEGDFKSLSDDQVKKLDKIIQQKYKNILLKKLELD